MQLATVDPSAPRRLLNHDGFQVQFLPETGAEGGVRGFHFVVKRTYRIEPGGSAVPTSWQRPLIMGDVYYEGHIDPLGTSIQYETELVPPKPACDVVLNGHCYAPGEEATQVVCSLRVGEHEKSVRVIGDRSAWRRAGESTVHLTAARPFSVMPLRWENAYGGVDLRYPAGPMPHPGNPAGKGFWAKPVGGMPDFDRYGPLPNLEDPARPIELGDLEVDPTEWDSGPTPTNFGWSPRHWAKRAALAGMDPKVRPLWEMMHKNPPGGVKMPFKEMQPAFLNGAPEGQVVPYLNGGEKVVLTNLHRDHARLSFRLPVDHPRLRWDCGRGEFVRVKLKIDTVFMDPDLMLVDVLWRGSVPAPEGFELATLGVVKLEVDGAITLPAQLLDTGFPLHLLTEGQP